jgi:hypothetical protein
VFGRVLLFLLACLVILVLTNPIASNLQAHGQSSLSVASLSDGHSLQKLNFKDPWISRIELPFASVVIEVNAAPGFAGFVLLQFGLGAPQFG